MSSPGLGTDVSLSDVNDLLHKLITESIKVQAVFAGVIPGLTAMLQGVVKVGPSSGAISVTAGEGFSASYFSFDPRQATVRKYADARVFGGSVPVLPGAPRFRSALSFAFRDTSQLTLLEMEL
jgi:hypothetical protein